MKGLILASLFKKAWNTFYFFYCLAHYFNFTENNLRFKLVLKIDIKRPRPRHFGGTLPKILNFFFKISVSDRGCVA